jgi:Transmembrane amino acid transporter protein
VCNVLNILLGVGLLSLPFAFKQAGWAGLPILLVMGLATSYTGQEQWSTPLTVVQKRKRPLPHAATAVLQLQGRPLRNASRRCASGRAVICMMLGMRTLRRLRMARRGAQLSAQPSTRSCANVLRCALHHNIHIALASMSRINSAIIGSLPIDSQCVLLLGTASARCYSLLWVSSKLEQSPWRYALQCRFTSRQQGTGSGLILSHICR